MCKTSKATIQCGLSTAWTGYVAASPSSAPLLSRYRLSIASILPVPVFGNVCASLETYVELRGYSRHRTRFHLTF